MVDLLMVNVDMSYMGLIYLRSFIYIWLMFMVNQSKYTSPMDLLGNVPSQASCFLSQKIPVTDGSIIPSKADNGVSAQPPGGMVGGYLHEKSTILGGSSHDLKVDHSPWLDIYHMVP